MTQGGVSGPGGTRIGVNTNMLNSRIKKQRQSTEAVGCSANMSTKRMMVVMVGGLRCTEMGWE